MSGKFILKGYEKDNYFDVPYWQEEIFELMDLLEDLKEFYEESDTPENIKAEKLSDIKWQILKLDLTVNGLQSEGGPE